MQKLSLMRLLNSMWNEQNQYGQRIFICFKDTVWGGGSIIVCVPTGLWGAGTAPELGLGNVKRWGPYMGMGARGCWRGGESN